MKATAFSSFLARIDTADYRICRRLNRGASPLAHPQALFSSSAAWATEFLWYVLILLLPMIYGAQAGEAGDRDGTDWDAWASSSTGVLKRSFVRERPFIRHAGISQGGAPLDRYSFPSGHTLHAVSFTWQATMHFPELGWVLVPLAASSPHRAWCWGCTIRPM